MGPGEVFVIFMVVFCGEQGLFDCEENHSNVYNDETCSETH